MAGIFDVVGYDFKGDRLCGRCVVQPVSEAYPSSPKATDDMTAEEFLTAVAQTMGINRMHEKNHTANQFPKVVFRGNVQGDTCDSCSEPLA